MQAEVEVGVRDIAALFNVAHVPNMAVERIADASEGGGKGAQLTGLVIRFGIGYARTRPANQVSRCTITRLPIRMNTTYTKTSPYLNSCTMASSCPCGSFRES